MNDDVINLISSSEDESESEPPQKIPAQPPEPVLQMMQTLLKGMPMPFENLKEVKVEKQTAKVKKTDGINTQKRVPPRGNPVIHV